MNQQKTITAPKVSESPLTGVGYQPLTEGLLYLQDEI